MSLSPQSDDDGSAATLMAETMGFSSFGTQSRPSKKRRMNADVAAVHIAPSAPTAATTATAGQVVASGALTVPADQSGGASGATHHREKVKPTNLPLHRGGAATVRSQNLKSQNEDEIDLDADDEQAGGEAEGGAPLGTTSAVSSLLQPRTGASTLPPRPPPPAPTNLDGNCCSESTSQHGFDIRLAPRPHQHQYKLFAGPNSSSGSLPSGSRDNINHHKWWLDYYDPTFNRNPWEALERKLGLEPRGSWPPRAA